MTKTIGAEKLVSITASPALTGFTASKILWVRENEPEIFKKCAHILLPKDYIRYKLTGVIASEVSDASGTQLFDIARRRWSHEMLDGLGISKGLMPCVSESYEITGTVSREAAAATGLEKGTPVAGGAADNCAAAVGTGVVEEGRAFVTLGTSGVIFAHSEKAAISPGGAVHIFCSAVPGAWTNMSCTLSAGLSLRWYRDNFCAAEKVTATGLGIDPYSVMDAEASEVPIGSNRLIFLPYLMGERSPILDERARGAYFGLSAIHAKRDLMRAVMEGVAYSQRACLEVFNEMGVNPTGLVAAGGGGKSPLWRRILSDVLNLPISTVENDESPALGAAILAATGAGLYENIQTACALVIRQRLTETPKPKNVRAYEGYYGIYKGLYPAMKESMHALYEL